MSSVPPPGASLSLEQVLAKLTTIAMQIHQSSDLEEILNCTAREARLLIQSDRALIYQFLPDGDGVVIAESVAAGWRPIIGQLIYDPCFQSQWGDHYQQGRIRMIDDIETEGLASCYVELLIRCQVKANLIVPIPGQDRVWGLLISHQCRQARSWQPIDVHILQQIALQLGSAVQYTAIKQDISSRKHLESTLRQQTERERLLTQIAHNIRRSLDLDQILSTTVAEVRQFLQVDRVLIYHLNPDRSGKVMTESVASGCLSILNAEITDSYFVETCDTPTARDQICQVTDIYMANFSPCHIDLLEELQIRAKLVVPILQTDRIWGFLIAHQCQRPRCWHPFEAELLAQLATQLAIAIHQSELYNQVQTLNSDLQGQVQERTAQLQQSLAFESTLKRITDKVRDSLDEAQILQTAVEELAQSLHIDACGTGIYNADQTLSTIAYEFVTTLSPARGTTFSIVDSPHPDIYPALFQGKHCQFCDITPNPIRSEQRLLTTLACPIVDDQGILGDLWLFKQPDQIFNDLEVRLVQQTANQCAIALRQSRLYQAAQTQVKELARLNHLKDDFLSTVSHELRTPITNIKLAVDVLELALEPLGLLADPSTAIYRYFQILKYQCQREIQLINDLLQLTHLDAGTEPLTLTLLDLQFVIPHIAEPFVERAAQQQQTLQIDVPSPCPPLFTDLSYLDRIVSELLHNACKYTPSGGQIKITVQSQPDWIAIQISNSGVEISPQECDRIFDKFYRIPNHDPWRYGGTGLGLALVKRMVEYLQGAIAVQSQPGQVTFTIQLPHTPVPLPAAG